MRTQEHEDALVWATSLVASGGPADLGPAELERLSRELAGEWGPDGIGHAEALRQVVHYWWGELAIRIVDAVERRNLGLAAALERMIDIAWDQPGLCNAAAMLDHEVDRGDPPLTGPVQPVLAAAYPDQDTSLACTLVALVVDQAARRYPVESHVEIQSVLQRLERAVDQTLRSPAAQGDEENFEASA